MHLVVSRTSREASVRVWKEREGAGGEVSSLRGGADQGKGPRRETSRENPDLNLALRTCSPGLSQGPHTLSVTLALFSTPRRRHLVGSVALLPSGWEDTT